MSASEPPLSAALLPLLDQPVFPGDAVLSLRALGGAPLRTGPSLRAEGELLRAERRGVLRQTPAGKLWLERDARRYLPQAEERVVGCVTEKHAEARARAAPPPPFTRRRTLAWT